MIAAAEHTQSLSSIAFTGGFLLVFLFGGQWITNLKKGTK